MKGVEDVLDVCRKSSIYFYIAHPMRYHPGLKIVKSKLQENAIGKVIKAHIEHGSYMPDWRPGRDYREVFSSIKDLGGGVMFDQIHEVDTLLWLLGPVRSLTADVGNSGTLEIEDAVEDYATSICRMESGANATVHVDYFRRDWTRTTTIVGSKGTLKWDQYNGETWMYDGESSSYTNWPDPLRFERNSMYLEEADFFLNGVCTGSRGVTAAVEGKNALAVVEAAKLSFELGEVINIKEFVDGI